MGWSAMPSGRRAPEKGRELVTPDLSSCPGLTRASTLKRPRLARPTVWIAGSSPAMTTKGGPSIRQGAAAASQLPFGELAEGVRNRPGTAEDHRPVTDGLPSETVADPV